MIVANGNLRISGSMSLRGKKAVFLKPDILLPIIVIFKSNDSVFSGLSFPKVYREKDIYKSCLKSHCWIDSIVVS